MEEDPVVPTEMAKESCRALVASSTSTKHSKESSGDVRVLPDTTCGRPLAKKLSSRWLDFGLSSLTPQYKESSVFI